MNKIYIAIEGNAEHKASVYALTASLVTNKYRNSEYVIYIIANQSENDWLALRQLENNNIEIRIQKDSITSITETKKVIYLKWNTLVMGDLSDLYHIDLEGKSFAAAKNLPEAACMIPFHTKAYNDAVQLIQIDEWDKDSVKDYKELSVYYNYGYEEYLQSYDRSLEIDEESPEKKYLDIKKWALILRTDENHSPEKYFDTAMSDVWLHYYKLSPQKEMVLNRGASYETSGAAIDCSERVIPIMIPVKDEQVASTIELLRALTLHNEKQSLYDIRIVYTQLSLSNKQLLLSEATENMSIVLYNVKQNYWMPAFELWTAQIFDAYDKAICLQPNTIVQSDISALYDIDMAEYWLAAGEKAKEDTANKEDAYFSHMPVLDKSVFVINTKAWRMCEVSEKVHTLWSQKEYEDYTIAQMLYIICCKHLMWLNTQEYIVSYEEKEDENLKEVLNQLRALEEENNQLKEKNRSLQAEKKVLTEERDQFLYEILEIRKSFTYKAGRLLTFLPRLLRGQK